MDPPPRNGKELDARIEKITTSLLSRFENIIGFASIESPDFSSTAFSSYQMEVETTALIRATEDILTLTRQMQEMWLLGNLNTLGQSTTAEKTDEDGKVVAELLEKIIKSQNMIEGKPNTKSS